MADSMNPGTDVATSLITDVSLRPYEYHPLPGPDWFRVLIICPAEPQDSVLRFKIETARLSPAAKYAALSYSWGMHKDGDDSETHSILVDGCRKGVTKNLYEALWRIRSYDEYSRLWIDAVCINQLDLAERNAQVAQMGDVFAHAKHVIAWLGEDLDHDDVAVASCAIKCLSQPRDLQNHHESHMWRNTDESMLGLCDAGALLSADCDSPDYDCKAQRLNAALLMAAETITSLLHRQYFTRRWVVQELFYAHMSSLVILCCSRRIWMSGLLAGLDRIAEIDMSIDRLREAVSPPDWRVVTSVLSILFNHRTRLHKLIRGRAHARLLELLVECSDLGCAGPRDILYSLVSMDKSFGITPNYARTISIAYLDFATKLVQNGQIAILLHNACKVGSRSSTSLQLPSWVPDLRIGFSQGPFHRIAQYQEALEARVLSDAVLTMDLYLIGQACPADDTSPSSITFMQPNLPKDVPNGETSGYEWIVPDWGNHQSDRTWQWPHEHQDPLFLFARSSDTGDRSNMYIWLRYKSESTWGLVSTLNPHGGERESKRRFALPVPACKVIVHIA